MRLDPTEPQAEGEAGVELSVWESAAREGWLP